MFGIRLRRYGVATLAMLLAAFSVQANDYESWAKALGMDVNVSYEATRLMETSAGNMTFFERKAPGKQRMEMNAGGMNIIAILREDQGKAYSIMPDMGFYQETSLAQAQTQAGAAQLDVANVRKVGREQVGGISTTKYQASFRDESGSGDGFMWVSDDGIGVKMDITYSSASAGVAGQRMVMTLKDLKVRAQDASYFELPANVQPMNMGALMGQMGAAAANDPELQEQASRPASQPASQPAQPTIVEEIGDAALEETEAGIEEGVRERVREGIRGLFRR